VAQEAGVQAHPQQFWFVKNSKKILENLGKILENPGKNGAQRLQKNTRPVFGGTPKYGLHHLCGRKFAGKSRTKYFSGKFGKIRAKILFTPINLPTPTPMAINLETEIQKLINKNCANINKDIEEMTTKQSLTFLSRKLKISLRFADN